MHRSLVLPPKRHCFDRPECDELKLACVFRHEERGNSGFYRLIIMRLETRTAYNGVTRRVLFSFAEMSRRLLLVSSFFSSVIIGLRSESTKSASVLINAPPV